MTRTTEQGQGTETAIFAGGCFWCTEAVFVRVRGVQQVESGYIGGQDANPSYREVCGGRTGHAEAVRVRYDPQQVSYPELLRVFFGTHDPTSLNRQGADVGTQYRSAVFVSSEQQADTARAVMAEVQGSYAAPIVTTIEEATTFYPAEEEHRDFYARNPDYGYCRAVVSPKVSKLRQSYAHLLRESD